MQQKIKDLEEENLKIKKQMEQNLVLNSEEHMDSSTITNLYSTVRTDPRKRTNSDSNSTSKIKHTNN